MKRQIIERDRSLQNLIGRRLFTEVYFCHMAARYDVSLPDAPEELTEDLCAFKSYCLFIVEGKNI